MKTEFSYGDIVRIKGEEETDFYEIIGTERRPNGDMLINGARGKQRRSRASLILVASVTNREDMKEDDE